ncbi:CHAT domain-containing protein [Roseateles sp. DXS20W]|uniref:CHAT domain-containing protein n=1 Tax=Pelomonas lactea TaxID=3299030 RepID=A0ABW7GQD6_9BURK
MSSAMGPPPGSLRWFRHLLFESLDFEANLRPAELALISRLTPWQARWARWLFSPVKNRDRWWARWWFTAKSIPFVFAIPALSKTVDQGYPPEALAMSSLRHRCLAQGGSRPPPAALATTAFIFTEMGHHETARSLFKRLLEPSGGGRFLRWLAFRQVATIPGSLVSQGELVAAHAFQTWVHEQSKDRYGCNHLYSLHALHELAELSIQMGQWEAGLKLLRQELDLRSANGCSRSIEALRAHASMAKTLRDSGNPDAALDHAEFVLETLRKRRKTRPDEREIRACVQMLLTRIRAGRVDESTQAQWEQLSVDRDRAKLNGYAGIATSLLPLSLELNARAVRLGGTEPAYRLIDALLSRPNVISGDADLVSALLSSASAIRDVGEVSRAQNIELQVLEALSAPTERIATYVHHGWFMSSRLGRALFKKMRDYERNVFSSRHSLEVVCDQVPVLRRLQFGQHIISRWSQDSQVRLELQRVLPAVRAITLVGLDELELERGGSRGWIAEGFRSFHEAWVSLCERCWHEEVLSGIAPLHGMETWIYCVGPGLAAGADEIPQARDDYVEARRQMTAVRMRVDDDSAGPPPLSVLKDLDPADLGTPHEVFRAARGALAMEDRAFAAMQWLQAMTPQQLVAAAGPSCIVLLDVINGTIRANVLRAKQALQTISLGALETLRADMAVSTVGYREAQAGLRDVIYATRLTPSALASVEAELEPEEAIEALRGHIRTTIWSPLVQALGAAVNVDLVTGTGLHALPLALGKPQGWKVRHFCGLAAYVRLRMPQDVGAPVQPWLPSQISIFTDEAEAGGRPIPFVNVEASIVGKLFAEARREHASVRAARHLGTPSTELRPCLQIATHGTVMETRSGGTTSQHGALRIDDAAGQILDAAAVMALSGDIREVFISACVAGMVGSSETGDPLGVVSSLQLKGAQTVVACLAPVSDFWMPLLVGGYWALRLEGTDPQSALTIAKLQLVERDWPEGFRQVAKEAYREGMQAILADTAAKTVEKRKGLERLLAGWPTSSEFRSRWFESDELADPGNSNKESLDPMDAGFQASVIKDVLEQIFDNREEPWQATARKAIEHLNAYTVCYG